MTIEPELELAIGGTYTDITPDAYFTDGLGQTAGASAEATETEYTRVEMRLKSPNGKYSNRNPLSPYFGQIGRNTPIRASVGNGTATMLLPLDEFTAKASTPDTAALDITGDIDIRVDLSPDMWSGNFEASYMEVAAKNASTGARSWAFFVNLRGALYFQWSADGTATLASQSTEAVPFGPRRRGAIRVTLDVNNGAAGNTTTFYTAPTIDGPWTPLGDPVVQSGVTSIFNSTAAVDVGDTAFNVGSGARRQIHSFELRNGIDGTVVANPVFLGQPDGTTSFADSTGKTWTLSGGALITTRRTRFTGEVSEWEPRWRMGADDVSSPIVASGLMRRLEMGESPLQSTLRRRVPTFDPYAYWPMEDGENATEAASALPGGRPLNVSGFTFQSDGTLGGTRPLPEVAPLGWMRAEIAPPPVGSPTEYTINMVYRFTGTRPVTNAEFLSWRSRGTIKRWRILMRDGVATVEGYAVVGEAPTISQSVAVGDDVWDDFVRFRFTCEQSGGTVNWRLTFVNIGMGGGSMSNSYAGTASYVSEIHTTFGQTIENGRLIVGHLAAVQETDAALDPYNFADHGFDGDRAVDRMVRLAEEEGIPLRQVGVDNTTHRMGPQGIATFMELMRSCEAVDGGVLYEDPDRLGLMYRTRETKYRQVPALTVPYSKLVQPLEPTDDDQLTRNDITRNRTEGSSFRVVQEDGPMSVQLPPDGVGRYTDSLELNVQLDSQLEQQAGWGLHKGTWDEARYKKIKILLHKHLDLIPQILDMQVGDLIRITDLPDFLPPGPVDLILEGFSENFTGLTWEIELNCSPGGIWAAGETESSTGNSAGSRADTAGSELLIATDSTTSTLYVQTTRGPQWVSDPFQYPIGLKFGGEEVTAVAAGPVLTPNPLLGVDLSSWSALSGTIDRSTDIVHTGRGAVASMRITPTGASSSSGFTDPISAVGTIIPGQSYTMSGWVMAPLGWSDMRIVTDWFNAAGGVISASPSVAIPVDPGEWTYITVTATAPALASRARVRARVGATPSVTDLSYWWAVRLSPTATGLIHDLFDRTVASGWGVADSGQGWSTSGGVASDYAVASGRGTHTLTTVNASRRTFTGATLTNPDLRADIQTSALATGASLTGALMARYTDVDNLYMARLVFNTDQTINLQLRKRVAAVETDLETVSVPVTHVANTDIRLRFQVSGDELRAKAWDPALSEPLDWQARATDTSLSGAAPTGTRSLSTTGNTNVNPVVRYDDFEVLNPQLLTVIRSENGIVKSHDAGTPVTLTDPMRAVL